MSPNEQAPELVADELAQIVASVFETMMSLEACQCGAPGCPSPDRVRAVVRMTSGWSGAVLVECGHEQARRFTGRFLAMAPPDSVDDLVRDVLGELANMIGGNLKCVLKGGMRLSMPRVADGDEGPLADTRVHQQLAFQTEEGPFQVSVVTAL
jgi:CheY-specific phosphatase CheX